ncbi:MAG TPA: BACON domain-containing protein, partial [Candidatus Coprenecus pullicola]|nr:BACON domain-containing protein [Candidatus Coprenecus pullicola]
MKKFIILMYAGLMLCLAGCQEKHETPVQDPGLRLENSVVNVSAEGGTMSVAWTVENPIDGMNVDIVPDYPEWLNRFDVSVEGKISFNVDEYTGQETREAVVAVNYGEDSSSFRVVQAGMEEPDGEEAIKLEIIEARPNTVIVSIETDGDLTYFINIEEKSVWDQYAGEEDVFAHDMELFQWNADGWGISLEAWMREEFGSIKYATPYHMFMYVQDGVRGTVYLKNNTEYVVYAYGINAEGERLTDLYSIETATVDYDQSNPVT